jgi:ferrous iron transport protein B
LFLLYFLGALFAILSALLLKKFFFKRKEIPFVMELPPYRFPTGRSIIKHVWFKTGLYLKKIGGVILLASIIVWVLANFPRNVKYTMDYDREIKKVTDMFNEKSEILIYGPPEQNLHFLNQKDTAISLLLLKKRTEQQKNSFMGMIGQAIEPVMSPLGFDWRLSVSILSGIAAKEVVVSTLGILYQADNKSGQNSLVQKIQQQKDSSGRNSFTPLIAFSFMLFILTYFPCIGVITAISRESGSWKWAAFTVVYTTSIAWILSFAVYQIGSLILV